jgi:hypothetical protein
MPTVVFKSSSSAAPAQCGPFPAITLMPTSLVSSEGTFAEFRDSTWWVNRVSYGSADVAGPVTATFRSADGVHLRLGPYPTLRLAANCLQAGGLTGARASDSKWYSHGDPKEYEAVVLT